MRDLLQDQLNFKKVDTESYIMKDKYGNTVTSREDSIAYTLGYKNFLEGGLYTTVVAVAIRGGGYGREWASNFDIGYSGQHTGFSHAAKMVSNGLKEYIEERVLETSNYIVENNSTVRQCARQFGISKSTVHKDVTDRLIQINPALAGEARKILDVNKEERHIRGGLATREKYLHMHH